MATKNFYLSLFCNPNIYERGKETPFLSELLGHGMLVFRAFICGAQSKLYTYDHRQY